MSKTRESLAQEILELAEDAELGVDEIQSLADNEEIEINDRDRLLLQILELCGDEV